MLRVALEDLLKICSHPFSWHGAPSMESQGFEQGPRALAAMAANYETTSSLEAHLR